MCHHDELLLRPAPRAVLERQAIEGSGHLVGTGHDPLRSGILLKVGNTGTRTAAHKQMPLVTQEGICLVHGVQVHPQVARERPHAGKPVSGPQLASRYGGHHLIANLLVDGTGRGLIDIQHHMTSS